MLEDADLLIPGETEVLGSSAAAKGTIPIRQITDFTIYDLDTMMLIPFKDVELISPEDKVDGPRFGASGIVKPWTPADDEAFEDERDVLDDDLSSGEGQWVKLSRIIDTSVHHYDSDKGCFDG